MTLILSCVLTPCSQADEPARLENGELVIRREYIGMLVERLESQRWLKRENKKLRERLGLAKKIAGSLREELSHRKKAMENLRKSAGVMKKRMENSRLITERLEENLADYREMVIEASAIERERKKELKSLRRRLAGQKIALWTVSAAGGALFLFLLF